MNKNGNAEHAYENENRSTASSSNSASPTHSNIANRQLDSDLGLDIGDDFSSLSISTSNEAVGSSLINKDEWYYNMKHKHCGIAIIFNHHKFQYKNLDQRHGFEVDGFNLKASLEKLGFCVIQYVDLTLKKLDKTISLWANYDYSDYDCFLMAVLTHGDLGIMCANDASYSENKLWEQFTDDKCVTLAGKPKLFFIQCCRGERLDCGVELLTQVDGGVELVTQVDGGDELVTQVDGGNYSFSFNHKDFLIAFSTIPDFYSWRHCVNGSWFIQALCIGLDTYGFKHDLLTILTFVLRKVATDHESNVLNNRSMNKQKLMPCIESMLTKLVKFERK